MSAVGLLYLVLSWFSAVSVYIFYFDYQDLYTNLVLAYIPENNILFIIITAATLMLLGIILATRQSMQTLGEPNISNTRRVLPVFIAFSIFNTAFFITLANLLANNMTVMTSTNFGDDGIVSESTLFIHDTFQISTYEMAVILLSFLGLITVLYKLSNRLRQLKPHLANLYSNTYQSLERNDKKATLSGIQHISIILHFLSHIPYAWCYFLNGLQIYLSGILNIDHSFATTTPSRSIVYLLKSLTQIPLYQASHYLMQLSSLIMFFTTLWILVISPFWKQSQDKVF